ncbi:MAG TPA: acyl-CoA dehydrogenase family protein, partial [Aggregatilineales bacterium]|nr:acyl-CoA dehydrogenase family protein [Aggregatilineales bacterium]
RECPRARRQGLLPEADHVPSGKIGIGALRVGLAQSAFEEPVKYPRQREVFGHAIADFQAIQWMIPLSSPKHLSPAGNCLGL